MSTSTYQAPGRRRAASSPAPWFASFVLYPGLAILAVALVVTSLRPQLGLTTGVPQAGALENGQRVFGPQELAQMTATPGFVAYVRHEDGAPAGVRIGVRPDVGALGAGDGGAVLKLDPAAVAELQGRPVRVRLRVRSIDVTNAQRLAVALETPFGRTFVDQALVLGEATLTYDLPAPDAAPEALVLRPVSDRLDYTLGVEIQALGIGPAS